MRHLMSCIMRCLIIGSVFSGNSALGASITALMVVADRLTMMWRRGPRLLSDQDPIMKPNGLNGRPAPRPPVSGVLPRS
jgi:hypothetical protein